MSPRHVKFDPAPPMPPALPLPVALSALMQSLEAYDDPDIYVTAGKRKRDGVWQVLIENHAHEIMAIMPPAAAIDIGKMLAIVAQGLTLIGTAIDTAKSDAEVNFNLSRLDGIEIDDR